MIISVIGRLIQAKGVQDVIKATRDTEDTVLIIGDGVYRKELEKITHKGIIFMGTLDKEEVKEILKKTDVLIMPSYNEGLPTTILEAGAMGVEVISSDVGSVDELINDNITGLLYDAGNIQQLKMRIEEVRNIKTKGLKETIHKHFTWEQACDKFERILR